MRLIYLTLIVFTLAGCTNGSDSAPFQSGEDSPVGQAYWVIANWVHHPANPDGDAIKYAVALQKAADAGHKTAEVKLEEFIKGLERGADDGYEESHAMLSNLKKRGLYQ